jgi:hypothetical protein
VFLGVITYVLSNFSSISSLIDMHITNIRRVEGINLSTMHVLTSVMQQLNSEERYNKDNQVWICKSIFLEVGQQGPAITTPYKKPLPELVDWWYSTCLGMGDQAITRPVKVLTLALRQRPQPHSMNAIKDTIEDCMRNSVWDPTKLEFIIQMFHTFNHQCVGQENLQMLEQLERARITTSSYNGPAVSSPAVETISTRTRRAVETTSTRTHHTCHKSTGGVAPCLQLTIPLPQGHTILAASQQEELLLVFSLQ